MRKIFFTFLISTSIAIGSGLTALNTSNILSNSNKLYNTATSVSLYTIDPRPIGKY